MSLRAQIVDVLQQQGLLTPVQAGALARPEPGRARALSTQLIDLGLDSLTVLRAICAETGWPLAPFARLRGSTVSSLPPGVDWRGALAVPFGEADGKLLVAFADPDLADTVTATLPPHRPHLAVEAEVRRLLDKLPGGARPALAVASAGGGAGEMAAAWRRATESLPPQFFAEDETEAMSAPSDAQTLRSEDAPSEEQSLLPWVVEPAASLEGNAPVGEDDPLGRFELLGEVLGRGGMAKVERARDKESGREIALKVLHPHLLDDEEEVARFAREVAFLERLRHGNIVRVLARSLTPPEVFVACELVEGYTAKDLIRRCAPMPAVAAARLMLEVLQALEHAHEKGVVHRDLKPENLLVSKEGPVKLCDFGVACTPGEKPPEGLVGTMAYMSPEQARGLTTDERSDLFSAGTVFFELLTGRNPFQAEAPSITMHRICSGDVPLIFAEEPTVPAAVERVIEGLMPADPARRFSSAAEPAALLEAFLKPVASLYDDLLRRCYDEPEVTQVLLRSDQSEAELARGCQLAGRTRSQVYQAALAFHRACLLDPANEEAATRLHDLCAREGLRLAPVEHPRAVHLRQALADEPDNAQLRLELSDLCRKEGDLVEAVTQLKRLLLADPEDQRARAQLAYLCGEDAKSPFGMVTS